MSSLKVLIVDDHALIRAGIRLLLDAQRDVTVVGEARDGEEALRLTETLAPDIVLMDVAMPGLSGIEATRKITQAHPDVRVLMLTMHNDEEYFFQAVNAGASGYALKETTPEDLLSSLQVVAHGGIAFHPGFGQKLIADYLRRIHAGQEPEAYSSLTEREKEILRLTAEGNSAREIGEMLVLSSKTVERHRANLMRKLDLHNRSQVVQYAVRKGLISFPS